MRCVGNRVLAGAVFIALLCCPGADICGRQPRLQPSEIEPSFSFPLASDLPQLPRRLLGAIAKDRLAKLRKTIEPRSPQQDLLLHLRTG
jgi:hypothetical protein